MRAHPEPHPHARLSLLPATPPGRWSLWLVLVFWVFIGLSFALVAAGQEGGDTLFSNLWLTVPMLIAGTAGVAAGAAAGVAIFRRGERSVAVFLTLLWGLVVTLFVLGELPDPH